MGTKIRKVIVSAGLAGLAAVLSTAPAGASRLPPPTTTTTEPSYVPPYGRHPHPDVGSMDPYDEPGGAPTVVPVDLPAVVTNPAVDGPSTASAGPEVLNDAVARDAVTRPEVAAPSTSGGVFGGILS